MHIELLLEKIKELQFNKMYDRNKKCSITTIMFVIVYTWKIFLQE